MTERVWNMEEEKLFPLFFGKSIYRLDKESSMLFSKR
jgi:hypothetical protein